MALAEFYDDGGFFGATMERRHPLAKLLQQRLYLLSQQLQGYRRRGILYVVDAPIVRNVLPLREPLPHQRPMFRFLDGDHTVGARQVASRTLERKTIYTPSRDFQLIQSTQRDRRDASDVVRPVLQRKTSGMRDPVYAAAVGVIIEELFGEPAAVVIAGAEEENNLHLVRPQPNIRRPPLQSIDGGPADLEGLGDVKRSHARTPARPLWEATAAAGELWAPF
jgi:hypothetical protein